MSVIEVKGKYESLKTRIQNQISVMSNNIQKRTETSPIQFEEYLELRLELLENIEHISDKDLKIAMKSKMEQIEAIDDFSKWKKQEVESLTSEVQSAISRLQNPADCSLAKKLVCHMNHHDCGLGCLMFHAAYCLIAALATERVLIFSDAPWSYSDITPLNDLFRPISSTCLDFEDSVVLNEVWPSDNTSTIEFVGMDLFTSHNMEYDPPSLPTGLAKRIYRIARNPDAWWVAQFIGYITRPNEKVLQMLVAAEENIDFSSPIVGVHVRRTDKIGIGGGAFLTNLEDYMEQVEIWFTKYEMSHPPARRRIYLATDALEVLQECQEKYPQYEVLNNLNTTEQPHHKEYTDSSSFLEIIQDIYILSLTNFVVCTFSSNVGVWVYELMHLKHGDASEMVYSMDIPWWFLYRKFVKFEAVVDDLETHLIKGDELHMDTTHAAAINNFNHTIVETTNIRTQEVHTYPIHKVKVIPRLYNFSIFN